MAGATYVVTCGCGRTHTITCPSPEESRSGEYPVPHVPSGPYQGYRLSVLDALPKDFLSRNTAREAVVVHLDIDPLIKMATEAGRHVIVTQGGSVAKLRE